MKKTYLILIFLFILIATSCRQENKDFIDISGKWTVRLDSTDIGISQKWNNPLAELNKRIFKSANRFVVNVVYILKDCKCTYFPEYSGKQSYCIFSIISHYHELIA